MKGPHRGINSFLTTEVKGAKCKVWRGGRWMDCEIELNSGELGNKVNTNCFKEFLYLLQKKKEMWLQRTIINLQKSTFCAFTQGHGCLGHQFYTTL